MLELLRAGDVTLRAAAIAFGTAVLAYVVTWVSIKSAGTRKLSRARARVKAAA